MIPMYIHSPLHMAYIDKSNYIFNNKSETAIQSNFINVIRTSVIPSMLFS